LPTLLIKHSATAKMILTLVSPFSVCRESELQEEIFECCSSGELRQTLPTIELACHAVSGLEGGPIGRVFCVTHVGRTATREVGPRHRLVSERPTPARVGRAQPHCRVREKSRIAREPKSRSTTPPGLIARDLGSEAGTAYSRWPSAARMAEVGDARNNVACPNLLPTIVLARRNSGAGLLLRLLSRE
jgi:hypothetical protein